MSTTTAPWGFGSAHRAPGRRTKPVRSDDVYVPPGWPGRVWPPGTPDWEQAASAFLLDACPPDYRAHPVLRRHPVVLARFASTCVRAQLDASRHALARCRADLAGLVPGTAIDEAAEAWQTEIAALERLLREIGLVEEALRGHAFVRRL